eukprot:SAG31_NODE_10671_length_1111_cov_1.764822_1_plen_74_part_10
MAARTLLFGVSALLIGVRQPAAAAADNEGTCAAAGPTAAAVVREAALICAHDSIESALRQLGGVSEAEAVALGG